MWPPNRPELQLPEDHSMNFLPMFLIGFYCFVVLVLSLATVAAFCEGRVTWVSHKFYTDGILVWFLPVVVILPVLLWPLSLVAAGIVAAYKRAQEAEEFCGISRGELRRRYRKMRGRLRSGYEELDPEQPTGDGASPQDIMLADSTKVDADDGDPESFMEQEIGALAGGKIIQDEPAFTTMHGMESVVLEPSEPPEYRP